MVRVLQCFGFPRVRGIRNLVCVPNPFRSLNLLCLDHHAISFLLFLFLHFQMYDSLLVKLTCSTFLVLCGFICRLRFKGFWNALRFVWISSYGYIYRIQCFPVASFWGHHCECSLDNQMTLDCTLKGEWNFGYMPRVCPYVALIWHSLCVPQEWCVREHVCPTRMVRVPLCSQSTHTSKGLCQNIVFKQLALYRFF
jgi:hypothetical protein